VADRRNRKSDWLRLGSRVISFALTLAAFGVYASQWTDQEALFMGFLCSMAGSFVSTFVHELGHAVTALACRWRVITFVVRPLGVQLVNGSIAWIGSSPAVKNELGWVLAVPRGATVDTPKRHAMIAGGPAASFALAACAFLWWLLAQRPGAGPFGGRLFLGLAIQALNAGFTALSPADAERGSDGDKLRTISKSLRAGSAYRDAKWIAALLASNVRLRDLPRWLIEQARAESTTSDDAARQLAAVEIGIVLDSRPVDATRARALIEDFRARFGSNGWLAACDAYLAAMWGRDVARANDLLPLIGPEPDLAPMNHAAHAVVAARAGQVEVARWHLKEMKYRVARQSPFPDLTFRDISRQIKAAIREAKHAGHAAQAAAAPSSAGPPLRTKRLSQ
jgi:hypothetical protein